MQWATRIPVSCGGVKSHVCMGDEVDTAGPEVRRKASRKSPREPKKARLQRKGTTKAPHGSTATLLRNFQANAATPLQGWRLCPKNRLLRRWGADGRERCVVQRHVAHLLRGQPGSHRTHEVGIGRTAAVRLFEQFERILASYFSMTPRVRSSGPEGSGWSRNGFVKLLRLSLFSGERVSFPGPPRSLVVYPNPADNSIDPKTR